MQPTKAGIVLDENGKKVVALYKFLKEFCSLKYKEITDIKDQPWVCAIRNIPNDKENIKVYNRDRLETDDEDEFPSDDAEGNILISVHKPEYQPCPAPPKSIIDWL